MRHTARTDEELLAAASGEPAAFGEFYRRHAQEVTAALRRRTGDAEAAADLTAETFAAALQRSRYFDPAKGPAAAWLFGIARRELARYLESGSVETRARRKIWMRRIDLDDQALQALESALSYAEAGSLALRYLDDLPTEQAAAVRARVIEDRDYAAIARASGTTQANVRQRVARGLARLRILMED